MLLGNSFELKSNSRVPNGTAGPVMITCLSINRRFCNRKTCLTKENKIDLFRIFGSDLGRFSFPPCRSRKRNKEALLAEQDGLSVFA